MSEDKPTFTINDIDTLCQIFSYTTASKYTKKELLAMYESTCPLAGRGVNDWLITIAYRLHRAPFFYKDEYIYEVLRRASLRCGRKVSDVEFQRAIIRSHPDTFNATTPTTTGNGAEASEDAEPDDELTRIASAQYRTALRDLRRISGVKDLESLVLTQVLKCLLTPDEWLAFDYNKAQPFSIRLYDQCGWKKRDLDGYPPQFIVPNPLLGPTGITQEGELSSRALSNIGKRRYIIIEFDDAKSQSVQASRILWLLSQTSDGQMQQWRDITLAMVLWSGKKSLHSWWCVEKLDEDAIQSFVQLAYRIYACKGATRKGQLVRTPTAYRQDTGAKQGLLYLTNNV